MLDGPRFKPSTSPFLYAHPRANWLCSPRGCFPLLAALLRTHSDTVHINAPQTLLSCCPLPLFSSDVNSVTPLYSILLLVFSFPFQPIFSPVVAVQIQSVFSTGPGPPPRPMQQRGDLSWVSVEGPQFPSYRIAGTRQLYR